MIGSTVEPLAPPCLLLALGVVWLNTEDVRVAAPAQGLLGQE